MKKLIISCVFLSVACYADAHVSHKDIKAAKYKYQHELRPGVREIDSLGWCELKAIRHDQRIPFFLRKKA